MLVPPTMRWFLRRWPLLRKALRRCGSARRVLAPAPGDAHFSEQAYARQLAEVAGPLVQWILRGMDARRPTTPLIGMIALFGAHWSERDPIVGRSVYSISLTPPVASLEASSQSFSLLPTPPEIASRSTRPWLWPWLRANRLTSLPCC